MSNYLANTNTGEIHKLSNVQTECKIDEIKEDHKLYLNTESEVDTLIKNDSKYDGCAFCYNEKHTK